MTRYRTHLSTVHPGFAIWDRRTWYLYWLTTILSFGIIAALVIQVSPLDQTLGRITAGLGLILWLVAIVGVWAFKRRGIERFHTQWNEEHGGPLNGVVSR